MSFLHGSNVEEIQLANSVASLVGRVLAQPIDVIKIKLQLQQYSHSIKGERAAKYYGIIKSTKVILKEEGVRALWKGHMSSQFFALLYNNIFFTSYKHISDIIDANFKNAGIAQRSFFAGGFSGLIATSVSYPFDLMRTRMMTQNLNSAVYGSSLKGFVHIFKTNGFLGFYKGLMPSTLELFLFSSIQFSLYETLKSMEEKSELIDHSFKPFVSFFISGMSGVVPKVLLVPIVICKKRLQTHGFEKALVHMGNNTFYKQSVFSWISSSIKSANNIRILYAGTGPTIFKSFVVSSIQLTIMRILLGAY